jgi:hypothetical protein
VQKDRKMKKIGLLTLLTSATLLMGSDFNIELTNETLMLNTTIELPKQPKNLQHNKAKARVRGDFLYYDNESKKNYYSLGVEIEGKSPTANKSPNLFIRNAKFSLFIDYSATKDNSALPIGFGFNSYNFYPLNSIPPLFFNFEIAYAPKVLSFEDATRFLKYKTELGIKPLKGGKIYLGYREIKFNRRYQSSLYVGVGVTF